MNGTSSRRRRIASSTLLKPRLVVAADEQLEGRHEVEEVLPHEARGDLVAAGQRLDLGFVPAAALLRLLRHDQPRAASLARSVGWRSVLLAMKVDMSATVA